MMAATPGRQYAGPDGVTRCRERAGTLVAEEDMAAWKRLTVAPVATIVWAASAGSLLPAKGAPSWRRQEEVVTEEEIGAAQTVVMAVQAGRFRAQFAEVRERSRVE